MIKDSGERTQFESGAVRDMHEGKGRMEWNLCGLAWMEEKHPKLMDIPARQNIEPKYSVRGLDGVLRKG